MAVVLETLAMALAAAAAVITVQWFVGLLERDEARHARRRARRRAREERRRARAWIDTWEKTRAAKGEPMAADEVLLTERGRWL